MLFSACFRHFCISLSCSEFGGVFDLHPSCDGYVLQYSCVVTPLLHAKQLAVSALQHTLVGFVGFA